MIFSRRDFNMVIIILAVILFGLTYLLAEPMIRQWKDASEARTRVNRDRGLAERLINTRGELENKLEGLRSTLPSYDVNEAVGAELLRKVRSLADENRVATTRITPSEEESIGDLFEQALECSWEAELEPLIRFLYAVQIAGATLDIRQMTVAPSREQQLKGNVKIYFAYTRHETEEVAEELTVEPESN